MVRRANFEFIITDDNIVSGVPGVGKTMTAETLARSLQRRMLRIDASDFEHNNAGQVSEVFKRYFHMASSWGALLLL
jgi:ATP-dependent 26S proteasome regulatory subunit